MTVTFLILTALVAIADWVVVGLRLFRLEYLFKPLALALLAAAAVSADLGPGRWWVVAALVFCLLGDVVLLGRDDTAAGTRLIAGATAFGVGHLCYLAAFTRDGLHLLYAIAGILIVLGLGGLAASPVLRGVRRRASQDLTLGLGLYSLLLGAMTVLAVATGSIVTAVGGVLFLISDTVLGRDRFVRAMRRGPLAVIVTYHLAQFLIVVGLITTH